MSYPIYNPDSSYEIGNRVIYNDVVYFKKYEGGDSAPGTEGSFWVDEEAQKLAAEAQLQEMRETLLQELSDAGFKPSYVFFMLKDLYS